MRKLFWVILPVILIGGALTSGVFIYQAGVKEEVVQKSLLPSLLPIASLEPSSLPELKREDLKLQVLNGRGVAGTAGEARDYLESLGYKEMEIGNADLFDYETTEVSIKKDKEDYGDLLREDLAEKYVISEKRGVLEAENEFDAMVVIGDEERI